MGHFDDSEVEEYLHRRARAPETLLKTLGRRDKLMNTLRRPLLLKVFGDLAAKENISRLLESASEAARLIERYVKNAHEEGLRQQQEIASQFHWSRERLAERCLKLYGEGELALDIDEDLPVILEPPPTLGTPREAQLLGIHKCPFLTRDQGSIRFAHRVFFEYSTAKGMLQDVERTDPSAGRPVGDESKAFNEFVLNADMRKFLRYMIENSAKLPGSPGGRFYELARRSLGLKDPHEWPMGAERFAEREVELFEVWKKLVVGTTEPERDQRSTEAAIDWFLANQDLGFHPLYLLYCYQEVATYLSERRWQDKWSKRSRQFSSILECRFQDTQTVLETESSRDRFAPWHLLLERILSIGLLLRYPWTPQRAKALRSWLDEPKWDQETYKRVEVILRNIEESVF
jgi:hypothetical protein